MVTSSSGPFRSFFFRVRGIPSRLTLNHSGIHVHQIQIYACEPGYRALTHLSSVPTQLLVQRYALESNVLAITGYAIGAEHRVYVHLYYLAANTPPQLAGEIALDDNVSTFPRKSNTKSDVPM